MFEAIAHHLSKFLPTVHGFDAFFGYLYHLDAMSDPYWYGYPQEWLDTVGPRHLIHSYATNMNDATVPPMQDPASFNPSEVKKQVDELIKAHEEQ